LQQFPEGFQEHGSDAARRSGVEESPLLVAPEPHLEVIRRLAENQRFRASA
jgi:hypothetical protein